MSESQSDRRRETLRTHMILTAATATTCFAAVIAASLFVPIVSHFDSAAQNDAVRAGLAEHILFLHSSFWPVVAVALISSVVSAVVLFQRMSSPLVRMVRAMHSIAQGRLPEPIVIRRVDYLQDEARALNAMTESLGVRWQVLRECEARHREAIDVLAECEVELPDALRVPFQELTKSGAELQQQIDELS